MSWVEYTLIQTSIAPPVRRMIGVFMHYEHFTGSQRLSEASKKDARARIGTSVSWAALKKQGCGAVVAKAGTFCRGRSRRRRDILRGAGFRVVKTQMAPTPI